MMSGFTVFAVTTVVSVAAPQGAPAAPISTPKIIANGV
jgi:hypothetical protein